MIYTKGCDDAKQPPASAHWRPAASWVRVWVMFASVK